jgi:hypothetical protein
MARFQYAGLDAAVIGEVVCQGPKAVVIGREYRTIYTLDDNCCVTGIHSHGYEPRIYGEPCGWMPYFRAVCGVRD